MVSSPALKASKPKLLDLPQELFDMILGFAYARSCQVRLVWKTCWDVHVQAWAPPDDDDDDDDEWLDDEEDVPEPEWSSDFEGMRWRRLYPGPLVAKFLVSKAFFVTAARIYIESGPQDLEYAFEADRMIGGAGVVGAFGRDVVVDFEHWLCFPPMPKMSRLRLVMWSKLMRKGLRAWKRLLERDEFEETWITAKALHGVSEHVELKVSANWRDFEAHDQHEADIYASNMKKLQGVLQDYISSGHCATSCWRPRFDLTLYEPTQLYPGSIVLSSAAAKANDLVKIKSSHWPESISSDGRARVQEGLGGASCTERPSDGSQTGDRTAFECVSGLERESGPEEVKSPPTLEFGSTASVEPWPHSATQAPARAEASRRLSFSDLNSVDIEPSLAADD